jgi:hypothetical protein
MSQTNWNNEQNKQDEWWSGSQSNSEIGWAQNSWALENQSLESERPTYCKVSSSSSSSCSTLPDNTLTQNCSSKYLLVFTRKLLITIKI